MSSFLDVWLFFPRAPLLQLLPSMTGVAQLAQYGNAGGLCARGGWGGWGSRAPLLQLLPSMTAVRQSRLVVCCVLRPGGGGGEEGLSQEPLCAGRAVHDWCCADGCCADDAIWQCRRGMPFVCSGGGGGATKSNWCQSPSGPLCCS
jgi:hypothetical protein